MFGREPTWESFWMEKPWWCWGWGCNDTPNPADGALLHQTAQWCCVLLSCYCLWLNSWSDPPGCSAWKHTISLSPGALTLNLRFSVFSWSWSETLTPDTALLRSGHWLHWGVPSSACGPWWWEQSLLLWVLCGGRCCSAQDPDDGEMRGGKWDA